MEQFALISSRVKSKRVPAAWRFMVLKWRLIRLYSSSPRCLIAMKAMMKWTHTGWVNYEQPGRGDASEKPRPRDVSSRRSGWIAEVVDCQRNAIYFSRIFLDAEILIISVISNF